MNEDELAAIEARANAATEGPWEWANEEDASRMCLEAPYKLSDGSLIRHDIISTVLNSGGYDSYDAELEIEPQDAEFIAHSRQDIPALIAEVRRLRELIMLVARSQREPWDMVLFDEAYDAVTEVEKTWTTTTS